MTDQHLAGWECPACHLRRTYDYGPDPCFGMLPGVDNACCGHGFWSGYITFTSGISIYFKTCEIRRWNKHERELIWSRDNA